MRIGTGTRVMALSLVIATPALMAPEGDCGQGTTFSRSAAPDIEGTWNIAYDDVVGVEVTLGGAVYTAEIGAQGGTVSIDHEGNPIELELDCEAPAVVCPSEVWTSSVELDQPNARFPHRFWSSVATQGCEGSMVAPEPSECGQGTVNPNCEDLCDGQLVASQRRANGEISEEGDALSLLLGAGIATNGLNCALLGLSVANAELTTTGTAEGGDWQVESIDSGVITVGYAGGCLWAENVDADPELEAVVIGASVVFTTGFSGSR